ncbi:MAG: PEP-CTERM sorting domain-containing protein [Oscillatoriales cyanobacterium RU_3_3]|nr:PEP-CTERM sorting domain-containing protein [Microcoleus sp. SU_5_3]NJL69936.1 PEP-CTERM sorting domain-containing protein [Microcoleus sp. SM1_3_4]NJM63755.1 PEP-CTERM sorting domain-containing protein [Oscillatoriales cyanobacterium RU_3_3]NJR20922.1 PEP-CTERM sorting domain-containing protein [Richelia sp. CSU_2_1]
MSGKSRQKVFRYLGAIALASTAALTAIAPKVQAAVLTYTFDTNLFKGYFKFNKLSQSEIDEITARSTADPSEHIIQYRPIIEGHLFYKTTDYTPDFLRYSPEKVIEADPETVPKSHNLATPGYSVSYYYGRFSDYQLHFDGLSGVGGTSQRFVYRVPPFGSDPGGIERLSTGWSWDLRSLVFGSSVVVYANHYREREGGSTVNLARDNITYNPVTYELVSDTDIDCAQPVPEPIALAGTALALAGIAGLKHKKKRADLNAKN